MNFSKVNKHNWNKGGLWIALIFLFVGFAKAQTSYPITDPRNPNCPCHKYQKLADDEFKKLLAQNNAVNKQKGINDDDQGEIIKPQTINPFNNSFKGISDDDQGKINKQINTNDDQKFGGISSDDLARINISEGDNVLGIITDVPGDIIVSEQKMGRSGSLYKAPRYSSTKRWKGKRKKHKAHYKQLKRIFCVSDWDIWKRKRITSACFHWK